jgi:hypothetical protein
MLPSILFLALSALGVNYGYEPLPEGGMRYIVQFTPEELREAEQAGENLDSDIPSKVGEVRSISIRLGNAVLPKELGPPSKSSSDESSMPMMKEPQQPDVEKEKGQEKEKEKDAGGESTKPWMPLILVAILLIVSVAGNVYLLWIYAELRKRCRTALTP